MNFSSCPVLRPYTYASHMGPGCEHGKPFFECGESYEEPRRTIKSLKLMEKNPLASVVAHQRTKLNDAKNESTLYTFGDPPSHRSRTVNYNKDGLQMHSLSHYAKIGSKHLNVLAHSRSSPIHPMDESKRMTFYDHSDVFVNGPWTTSSQAIGSLWHMPKNDTARTRAMPWLAHQWY
eukprot:GEMP01072715.1.p1 GENE.GEMP01072715.1~~GEMP01072715.1.p1  ORF type:complete len:177 (+),score=29.09 GEMP01072715.1:29-559(+)